MSEALYNWNPPHILDDSDSDSASDNRNTNASIEQPPDLTVEQEAAECKAIVERLRSKYRRYTQQEPAIDDSEEKDDGEDQDDDFVKTLISSMFANETREENSDSRSENTVEGFDVFKLRVPVSSTFSKMTLTLFSIKQRNI